MASRVIISVITLSAQMEAQSVAYPQNEREYPERYRESIPRDILCHLFVVCLPPNNLTRCIFIIERDAIVLLVLVVRETREE